MLFRQFASNAGAGNVIRTELSFTKAGRVLLLILLLILIPSVKKD